MIRASSAPFRYHQRTKIPTNAVGRPGRSSHYSRLFAARQKERQASQGEKASAWVEWATRIQSVQSLQWWASALLLPPHVFSRSAVSRCKRHIYPWISSWADPSQTVVATMSQERRDLLVTSLHLGSCRYGMNLLVASQWGWGIARHGMFNRRKDEHLPLDCPRSQERQETPAPWPAAQGPRGSPSSSPKDPPVRVQAHVAGGTDLDISNDTWYLAGPDSR